MSGRSTYPGFRATIKLVGTGPRGSRDLDAEEAREALAGLLRGETSEAQAGAFLVAMRFKGEAPEELAGFALALREAALPLQADVARPLVACAGAYDGVGVSPQLSIAAACTAAACGAAVVMHCGTRLGPKYGVTQADVLAELGGPAAPSPEQSKRMLERSGATLVHTPSILPGWARLARIRDEVGVRGPVHAAERLLAPFGAKRFVVGYTHSAYAGRLLGALDRLGAERAVVVRGIEGSDVVRPGRPTAVEPAGPLELPESLGETIGGADGAAASAAATRAVLSGEENGALRRAVAMSAAVRLYAAGVVHDPGAGIAAAEAVLEDGRAGATLDAMLGA